MHYTSHCPIVQKINLVKNEARRIVSLCTYRDDAKPHLQTLKANLLRSGYPESFITKYIRDGILNDKSKQQGPQPPNDKQLPSMVIPYIHESFTRIVKKELKRSGIEARVLVRGHKNLKRTYHRPVSPKCNCETCESGISCRARYIVYKAECKDCSDSYIGVTTRPFRARWTEHERSIRQCDQKSALSEHFLVCQNPNKSISGYNFSILDRATNYKDSFIREGVAIRSFKPQINRNEPGWVQYAKF